MNKTGVIIIAALLIIAIGVGSFLIFIMVSSKDKATEDPVYIFSTGESFLTNLKVKGDYVKADILVEVSDKKALKVLENNNYKIRDHIIEILGNIDEDFLNRQNFRADLRDLIKDDLQSMLNIDTIKGIYFNDFIIQ